MLTGGNNQGKGYIFLIEMKSQDTKGVTLKYRSTKIFLQFLASTLEKFYDNSVLDNFEVRSILFDRKPTSKGKEVKPRKPDDEIFYHQGFGKITKNETWINKFIK